MSKTTPLLPLLALLTALPAAAGESPPPPEVRWTRGPHLVHVTIAPARGTHLAPDLPLRVWFEGEGSRYQHRDLDQNERGPTRVQLPVTTPRDAADWRLRLQGGVCNDRGDICLPFHLDVAVPRRGHPSGKARAERGMLAEPPSWPEAGAEAEAVVRAAEAPEDHGPPWFAGTDPAQLRAAFDEAARRGAPLVLDFYGIWCPPCDRLRDEFFHAPAYRPLLERFVLVKLDADAESSFAIKDRYRVGGYPTVMVVDAEGEVLDRLVGYPGAEAVAARLRARVGEDRDPLAELRTLAAGGRQEDALRRLREVDGWPDALAGDPARLELAFELAGEAGKEDLPALGSLLAREAGASFSARAYGASKAVSALREAGRTDEADALLAYARDILLPAVLEATAPVVREGPTVELAVPAREEALTEQVDALWVLAHDLLPEDATARRAELLTAAAGAVALSIRLREARRLDPDEPGPPAGTRVALRLPEDLLAPARTPAVALHHHPGPVHDLLSLLDAAGLVAPAEPILVEMTRRFPDDFTWHHRLAGWLRQHRGAEAALPAAERALAASYGDNRLRAARRQAELLEELGRRDEAVDTVRRALASPAPEEENVRAHRYRQALQELLDGWAGSGDEAG